MKEIALCLVIKGLNICTVLTHTLNGGVGDLAHLCGGIGAIQRSSSAMRYRLRLEPAESRRQ